jgi:hypothetical protein
MGERKVESENIFKLLPFKTFTYNLLFVDFSDFKNITATGERAEDSKK